METINSFRDLLVWQKGMDLTVMVYRLTASFPKTEEYRLTGQLTRAAASIPANIAEGHDRGTRKEYANFVSIARGSVAEVETFLLLAERLDFAAPADTAMALALTREIARMLTSLRKKLDLPPGT